jgi:hypothetical protein
MLKMKGFEMKRVSIIIAIIFLMSVPCLSFAAGTVTALAENKGLNTRVLTLTCIGDGSNGSIPDTSTDAMLDSAGDAIDITSWIQGWRLRQVIIWNKSTETSVTGDSDVYIYDAGSTDLLFGSGVDQLDDDTRNVLTLIEYPPIISALTFSVANQGTVSGKYYIIAVFTR